MQLAHTRAEALAHLTPEQRRAHEATVETRHQALIAEAAERAARRAEVAGA